MKKYFYSEGEKIIGPIFIEDFNKINISRNTLVWYEGLENWVKADEVNELLPLLKKIAPPPIPKTNNPSETIDNDNTINVINPLVIENENYDIKNKEIKNKTNNSRLKIIIVLSILLVIFFIVVFKYESIFSNHFDQPTKPSNYKLINLNSITFLTNPFEIFLGFYENDLIGIELDLDNDAGSKELGGVQYKLKTITINYISENCYGDTKKVGNLIFSSEDPFPQKYAGKRCLLIGKVEFIDSHFPTDACDRAYCEIKLTNIYVEEETGMLNKENGRVVETPITANQNSPNTDTLANKIYDVVDTPITTNQNPLNNEIYGDSQNNAVATTDSLVAVENSKNGPSKTFKNDSVYQNIFNNYMENISKNNFQNIPNYFAEYSHYYNKENATHDFILSDLINWSKKIQPISFYLLSFKRISINKLGSVYLLTNHKVNS